MTKRGQTQSTKSQTKTVSGTRRYCGWGGGLGVFVKNPGVALMPCVLSMGFSVSMLSLGSLVALSLITPTLAHAQDDIAIVQANSLENNGFEDDMVTIGQVSKQNQVINDAVLGNDAIGNAIGTVSESFSRQSQDNTTQSKTTNINTATVNHGIPRQSTAQAVESDKLILNEPVVDQANILSAQEKQHLSQRLRGIYQQGLAQAAIVIIPTTNGTPMFNYALQVANRWQLGAKDTDDGLLILVAINDRNVYVLSGYGLEGVLPDAINSRIIREEITPRFKQSDYAGGLNAALDRIEERLTTDPDILAQADELASRREQSQSGVSGINPIVLFIIGLFAGNIVTGIFGRFLGSGLISGGFFFISMALGGGFILSLILAIFLWIFLMGNGHHGGGRGGRGGGTPIIVPGGFGGGSGGGFGGGGFGSGGFGGGGGGFGGGGAGGSW
ncbi:TPM domain-containing protein [Moraxella lincolnii]|nr:TPM domain-containing protein [Moraxella lincolnii]